LIIPDSKVGDVIAVFIYVVLVGDRQPGIQSKVVVVSCQSRIYRGRVSIFEVYLIALFFKEIGPQLGDCNALFPAVKDSNSNFSGVAVCVTATSIIITASGQSQGGYG